MDSSTPAKISAYAHAKMNAIKFRPLPHMEEYLEELAIAGKNKDYLRTLRNGLSHFADFMRSEGVLHPEEITRIHLVRFQGHVNDRENWSKSYRIAVMKKVRAWMNWMESTGKIHVNPWKSIKLGHVPKQPNPLSDDDFEQLFNTHRQGAFSMTPFGFHRREMILCLLYSWGLRIHELESINIVDMDATHDSVRVRNKGGTWKSLPFSPETKRVFQRWSAVRGRHAIPEENALLITQGGKRLTKDDIYKIVVALGEKAGVSVNPHQLRDTCGTHLLDDDVPVERVSKILGHTNTRQTLAYARVNNHKVAESHQNSMDPRLRNLFHSTRNLRLTPTERYIGLGEGVS
jgi:integrase/recombinase XerC